MSSLYQLDAELLALSQVLSDSEGVADDETFERYDALLDAREDKLDGYLAVIRNFESEEAMYAAEAKRFADLAATAKKSASSLKDRLLDSMQRNGEDELAGALGKAKVSRRSSRGVVLLDSDVESFPDRFKRIKVEPDRVALKKALEDRDEDALRLAEIELRVNTSLKLS